MPARSSSHWLTKILAVSMLLSPSVLQSCTALRCGCNQDNFLSDCRFSNPIWTCPLSQGSTMCGVIKNRQADGSIKRVELCLNIEMNPHICNGKSNSASLVYQCCNDRDYCNRYLNPLLPGEVDAVSSSSPTVPSSSMIELAPTSVPTSPPNSVPTSAPTSVPTSRPNSVPTSVPTSAPNSVPTSPPTASLPLPQPSPATLFCTCSNPKRCSGKNFCQTSYKCYRHDTLAEDGKTRHTELGCLDLANFRNFDKLDICGLTRDKKTSWLRCCNNKSHCNRYLEIDVKIPPAGGGGSDSGNKTVGNLKDSPTVPTTGDGKNDDKFYFIFSLAVMAFTMVTVVAMLLFLGLLWLRRLRGRAKVASSVFYTKSEKSFHKFILPPKSHLEGKQSIV